MSDYDREVADYVRENWPYLCKDGGMGWQTPRQAMRIYKEDPAGFEMDRIEVDRLRAKRREEADRDRERPNKDTRDPETVAIFDSIRELYEAGHSMQEIEGLTGLRSAGVYRLLVEQGYPVAGEAVPPTDPLVQRLADRLGRVL